MVFLFLSAVLFFCAFCGVGLLVSRFSFLKVRQENFFLNFFTGFAVVGMYFSLVQLFVPLTVWTLLPVLLAGLAGLVLCRDGLRARASGLPAFFAFCIFVLFMVSYAISNRNEINAYDDFLYHASILSWLNAYRVVPGIANLHFRLGMNSLYLQVAAGLDVGIWDKRSSSITVCLMYFSFLMYCLRGIYAACRRPSAVGTRLAVCQAVLACWLFFTEALEPYLNYDNPALVFIALVIVEMLPYCLGDAELAEAGMARTSWETIFLYSAVSFAIKPMGAVAVFLVFAAAAVHKARHGGLSLPRLFKLSVLPLCILALFIVRNVIQTGYLMFPMTSFRLDLPWTISKLLVDTNINAIQNYSRTIALGYDYVPGQGFWYWFIPWLHLVLPESNNILLPFVLLAGLVVAAVSLFRKDGGGVAVKLACYAFVLVNLLFCFITVPELRYDTVWIYALLALALFFSPGACSGFAALLGRARNRARRWGSRLARLAGRRGAVWALSAALLLLAVLLLVPAVRQALIALGSALARHELNAPHWQREFGRWGRVFFSLAVLVMALHLLWKGLPALSRRLPPVCAVMLALAVAACAFRDRNWLLPAAMYSFPVEKRLVNAEQPFYVYVACEGDQCGDAPLPCTPAYCFNDRLRLFDADDMGKGFYIAE